MARVKRGRTDCVAKGARLQSEALTGVETPRIII